MIFRKFKFLIIIQLLLIVFIIFIIVWSFYQDYLNFTSWYFVAVLIFQILYLFRFINKNNQDLLNFLKMIKYQDNLSHLNRNLSDGNNEELKKILNDVADAYSKIKSEKEGDSYFFGEIIRNINTGILSFDDHGKILILNEAAKKLLGVKTVVSLSSLKNVDPHIPGLLMELEAGKSVLFKLIRENSVAHLSFSATDYVKMGNKIRLISILNIKADLQQEEIKLWQKLISVLTHEIMNSIGPITSLSSTLSDTLNEYSDDIRKILEEDTLSSIQLGLSAIEKRSSGLAKFVETYRSLTKIPQPNFASISVNDFLDEVVLLMKEEVEGLNIKLTILNAETKLDLLADEKLLSQVMINLIRNAKDAVMNLKDAEIQVSAALNDEEKVIICVKDNGPGISNQLLDKIFIPFFTTREKGSGIGLALARQIMHVHKGTIDVISKAGDGANFILSF